MTRMLQIKSTCCLIQIITSAILIKMQMKDRAGIGRTYMVKENLSNEANRSRCMNSPQHHCVPQINATISYNSYMQSKKTHPKRQEPKRVKKIDTFIDNYVPVSPRHNFIEHESILLANLVNQNEFLIKELLIQKEKENEYQKVIQKLKRSKSNKEISFQKSPKKYIQIDERPVGEERTRLTTAESKFSCSMDDDYMSFQTQSSRCKQLLDDSLDYINHSKQSLSHQIGLLNDKLCRLIEESSVQRDRDRRKVLRADISNCVKDLQQLKRYFQKNYS